ncbi:hypothetical protein LS684_09450 [Cytobacillus spongiae]|jgi:energy-coupling factor transporter transmembrane protein EcfT|uniref:hypothetical protein n=1 Tax=Cytobacillus spongiae TaxID=2901381 RepID=UPI001F3DD888|nr:hypothetical protein [Cytobacillus spongiae]UII57626.1 hypothetical protein LS684_09450 [Cytobacillus spongiae]
MEIKLGGSSSIVLPEWHITILAIVIIYLLVKWSKELETRRFTIFFYFLISTFITPIFSHSTEDGVFELWVPLGFIFVFFYLLGNKRNHPAKMKACLLGFCIAIYQLIVHYVG